MQLGSRVLGYLVFAVVEGMNEGGGSKGIGRGSDELVKSVLEDRRMNDIRMSQGTEGGGSKVRLEGRETASLEYKL